MRPWLPLAFALLPSGLLLTAIVFAFNWWQRRQDRREQAELALAIRPPRYVYTRADEQLQQRTEQKRLHASKIRSRARRVESGAGMAEVLRMVAK